MDDLVSFKVFEKLRLFNFVNSATTLGGKAGKPGK